MTLHDDLRELVENFGPELLLDPEQFRAALDDYVDEGTAFPGQVNLLHDAVRFGALARCQEMLGRGGDAAAVIEMAGDGLARERGSLEVASARWAVATLAHAAGTVDRPTLELFLGSQPVAMPTVPDPPAWPTLDVTPPEPATPPTAMPSGPPPSSPPPTSPPPSVPAPPPAPGSLPAPTQVPSSLPSHPPPPSPPPPTATAPEGPPSQPVTAAANPANPTRSSSATPPPPPPSDGETVTALPQPPTPPPTSGTRRSRRKPVVAAVAAAVIAALIGTTAYAVLGGSDDPNDTAKDPVSSAPSDEPSSPSVSETTDDPPILDPPAKPRLTAEQSYRSVVFSVSGPVVDEDGVELEARIDGEWTTTRPRFRLTTDQGGQEECAEVRAVRVEGEARAPGPSQRLCEESKPRTIQLVRSATTCPPVNGYACFTYDLKVAGFGPGSRPTMEIVVCSSKCTKKIEVDGTGRGLLKRAVFGYAGTEITVRVDRLTTSVSLG